MQITKSRKFLIQICSLKYIAKIASEVLNLHICARMGASRPLPLFPPQKEWIARKQTLILAADDFVIIPSVWLKYTYSHLDS